MSRLHAQCHNNLGCECKDKGDLDSAIAEFRQAVNADPDYWRAWMNLAISLHAKHDDESERIYNRSLQVPAASEWRNQALYGLACWQFADGNIPEAERLFSEHRKEFPDDPVPHSNLLICDLYQRDNGAEYLKKALHWGVCHANPEREDASYPILGSEKMRIAYISPDFRDHVVGRFMEGVLKNHDRDRFKVILVSLAQPWEHDDASLCLAKLADEWWPVGHIHPWKLEVGLRSMQAHVIVDLAGHTANNRLTYLGARYAPIQMSYLGYPGPTGLRTMDYRIADARSAGDHHHWGAEKQIILPRPQWCFTPPKDAPAVGEPPSKRNGFVTFGSFNNIAKIQTECVRLWAHALRAVEDSRLLIKAGNMNRKQNRKRLLKYFSDEGIDPARIEFRSKTEKYGDHLATYNEVDIALDTFPYHGTTTTCEAHFMGVPVVSMAGNSHHSSVACTLNPSDVSYDVMEFSMDVSKLADDAPKQDRHAAQVLFCNSKVCEGKTLAQALETAYLEAWKEKVGS